MLYVKEFEKKLQQQVILQNMQPDFAKFWEKSLEQVRAAPIENERKKAGDPL